MTENIDTNRRGFLSRLSKPVSSLTEQPEKTRRNAPRPPKAVDEALFLRLCDGCEECLCICPNRVIEVNDQTATLNLDYNECSLCDECTKVCASGALHSSQHSKINLRPDFSQSCNNYLQIDCQQCVLGCPQAAISVEDAERPVVNEEKCNGCGQCRSHCYLGAITMRFHS
ncbi:ferredoxin-type protein NapF [Vibrio paucivorans]|uniref:Ferredoxin-type protein NapF n=1 Tax=Vibrio paucivorans TaxID=2829489 RepID=A0A9X3CEF5_9VIBR|nr:ferredoxin-type protein NapF [Vibrio paucivorans]MCW8334094.1 ferredoxin-type protein NapF [Vibrio paucivorans]